MFVAYLVQTFLFPYLLTALDAPPIDKAVEIVKEKYNKAKQDVDRWIDNLIQAQNDFLDFRDELRGIYRNGIDD